MAIKKSVTLYGVQVVDSYIRVDSFGGTKTSLDAKICIYAAKGEPEPFFCMQHTFAYDVNAENPLVQAYASLKKQEIFLGAADV